MATKKKTESQGHSLADMKAAMQNKHFKKMQNISLQIEGVIAVTGQKLVKVLGVKHTVLKDDGHIFLRFNEKDMLAAIKKDAKAIEKDNDKLHMVRAWLSARRMFAAGQGEAVKADK